MRRKTRAGKEALPFSPTLRLMRISLPSPTFRERIGSSNRSQFVDRKEARTSPSSSSTSSSSTPLWKARSVERYYSFRHLRQRHPPRCQQRNFRQNFRQRSETERHQLHHLHLRKERRRFRPNQRHLLQRIAFLKCLVFDFDPRLAESETPKDCRRCRHRYSRRRRHCLRSAAPSCANSRRWKRRRRRRCRYRVRTD